ncbi:MAG TPA: hypothetical protein VL523_10910 [Terriglobia bacterium]|nr:hypothetical protein [Terriglobia bacterium]
MPNTMTNLRSVLASTPLIAALFCGVGWAQAPGVKRHWLAVERGSLCVTEGAIESAPENRMAVNVPKLRAYVNRWTAQAIEARFTYRGPSAEQVPLASGEVRRQFGLKLRAQDGCNLVYAVWRFEPESNLVVSVKSNPDEHTSAACGNRGYRNVKPRSSAPVPVLRPGDRHTLRAEMNRDELRVFVDNNPVWDGSVGSEALSINGPVGIRSDNVRLELDLLVKDYAGPHPMFVLACKPDAEGSE